MIFKNLPDTSTPITAENLELLSDVVISTTEPINDAERKNIWVKPTAGIPEIYVLRLGNYILTNPIVSTSNDGFMLSSDKTKLNGIEAQANKTIINNTLSSTATNQALSANQGKILNDKITSKTTWTLLGNISQVGSSHALSIPSNANEIYIQVFPQNNDDGVSVYILPKIIASGYRRYDGGYYKSSEDMLRVLVQCSSSSIHIQELILNSSSFSSVYECKVYYR